jgi:hypothetical protein
LATGAVLPTVVATIVALTGCGGGSSGNGSADGDPSGVPQPTRPISAQIPVFERATSRLECDDALQVVHPSLLPQPEASSSDANCRAALSRLRTARGFQAADSAEYGTAAVVDGEANAGTLSLIFALDEDGEFKWISGSHTRREVGTEPPPQVHFEPAATALVAALRADDCRAAFATIAPDTRLYYGGRKGFCDKFEDTFTATPEGFGSRLQADSDARPVPLGATRDQAFYGVATEPAGYRTVIVNGAVKGDEATVYDVIPAER